jgi:hypothetical protein
MSKLWTFGDSFTAGHGCKFTSNGVFSLNTPASFYVSTYKNYIDSNKKIWPEIVADSLGLELYNISKNGMTNESIIDVILKYIVDIKKDDIVILQSSTLGRYDFPFLKEKTLMGSINTQYEKDDFVFDSVNSPFFYKTVFASNVENEYSERLNDVLLYTNAQESIKNKNVILDKSKYELIRNFFAEFISTGKYYERSLWRFVQIANLLKSMDINVYIINEDIWPMHLDIPSNLIKIHDRGMLGYIVDNNKTIYYDTNGLIDDYHPSYDGHIDIADFIIKFINNENINIHNP